MSTIPPYQFPAYGTDHWNTFYETLLEALRAGHNAQEQALSDRVTDAELATALEDQLAQIRQLPAPGADGQFLATVAGAWVAADLPGGGTGGDYPPVGGIPKTDLSNSVQTSLSKADSALQSIPSTYTTDDELAAAIATITLSSLGAASAADLDNVFGIATAAIPSSQKGAVNGVATLDGSGKLVSGQIPGTLAPLASPALTGTPTAPTPANATNTTQLATTAFVQAVLSAAINSLIASAPGTLDTLNELAAALGNDPNFATTITTALAGKVPTSRTVAGHALSADVTLVANDISNATAVGKALMVAADQAAGRAAIAAGTSSLALGTTSSTAKAGDWKPASTDITDATTLGRAMLTAATQVAARNALGFYDIALGGSVAGIPEGSTVFEAAS